MSETIWEKELRQVGAIFGVVEAEASAEVIGDAITSERDTLRNALRMAAQTFRKYEQLHRDKGTPEGTTKANSNMIIAQVCERALAQAVTRTPQARPEKEATQTLSNAEEKAAARDKLRAEKAAREAAQNKNPTETEPSPPQEDQP